MTVTFHKMQGAGNDFILLDLREQAFSVDALKARQMADRHTGIGCDQILTLDHPRHAGQLASFKIWNSDGSRAEQCGNGVRCLGQFLKMQDDTLRGKFLLGGPAGVAEVECMDNGLVRVDMGKPEFDPGKIPVNLPSSDGWYSLQSGQEQYRVGAVSMGNPHALMLVDDIDNVDVTRLGHVISHHPGFENGCNAGFAQWVDRENIRLRVFERGAAETLACGSGACAAMSILRKAGMVETTLSVTQAGGNLIISWTGGDKTVIMMGPATYVFRGQWHD